MAKPPTQAAGGSGDPAPIVAPATRRRGELSRRGLLGGALTAALAAAILPVRDAPPVKRPDRWRGTTRWIGHA